MEEKERSEAGGDEQGQAEELPPAGTSLIKDLVEEHRGEGESSDWPIPCSSGCYSHSSQKNSAPVSDMAHAGGSGQICWTPDSSAEAGTEEGVTCRPHALSMSLVAASEEAAECEGGGCLRRGVSVPQVNSEAERDRKGGFLRHFGALSRGSSADRHGDASSLSERSGKKRTGVKGFLSRSALSSLFRRDRDDEGTQHTRDPGPQSQRSERKRWRLPGLGKGKNVPPCQRALPPVPPRLCTSSLSETESVEEGESEDAKDDVAASNLPAPAAVTDNNLDFASSIERVKDHGWYWGPLSGEAAERILAPEPDGSFIVRDSSDHHYIFSLTFKLNGFVRHVRIEHDQGNFSFGSFTKFKSTTIVDFIENAVEHSRSGRYLFFLHRRPVLGPMRVQLLHPVSRFKRVQSLKHLCRYIIVKHVRKDHLNQLPVPKIIKTYLNTPFYYSEQVTEESDTEDRSFALNWGVSQNLSPPVVSDDPPVEASSSGALSVSVSSSEQVEPGNHPHTPDVFAGPVVDPRGVEHSPPLARGDESRRETIPFVLGTVSISESRECEQDRTALE